mmetsp:Transcript_5926/g.24012  ORF Transcript_5926/g.24012 Transcript_5926/m.24012 type:complete len:218 (+) Transcript_5926:1193-1846(+)
MAYPRCFASAIKSRVSLRALRSGNASLLMNCAAPPPRITFRSRVYTCSSAISVSSFRSATCDENDAGVACVTRVVVTTPVRIPASCAPSTIVPAGRTGPVTGPGPGPVAPDAEAEPEVKSTSFGSPTGTSPTTWLYVLYPVAYAVAPAAESVTSELVDRVRDAPTRCSSKVKAPHAPASRASVRCAGPMPSDRKKIRRFGFEDDSEPPARVSSPARA